MFNDFSDAIRAAGLNPPATIIPGRFHRFPGVGKKLSNRSGWCHLFEDENAGCFGDWSTGFSDTWFRNLKGKPKLQDWLALAKQIQKDRARAERVREELKAKAAAKGLHLWSHASAEFNQHPYLKKKQIKNFGARLLGDSLVLPIVDFQNRLTSLQFIDPSGKKRFLLNGRKKACYIPVNGQAENASRILICEGWATGCSLAEDEPQALVLAALDAGNLKPVALETRRYWPQMELVIAGDDDRCTRGNPGYTKAKEAAIASQALLAMPQWPDNAPEHLTDFNDLAIWQKGERF